MARKLTGGLVAAAMVAIALGSGTAADEKPKTIKQVMKAANGKTGLAAKIAGAAKDAKWDEATKLSTDFAAVAADLGKNKPPKGELDSWKTHTEQYSVTAKSFLTASEKKDADGVAAANKAFSTSCMACHKEHKGK